MEVPSMVHVHFISREHNFFQIKRPVCHHKLIVCVLMENDKHKRTSIINIWTGSWTDRSRQTGHQQDPLSQTPLVYRGDHCWISSLPIGECHRRWANIKTTLVWRPVFAEMDGWFVIGSTLYQNGVDVWCAQCTGLKSIVPHRTLDDTVPDIAG